MLEFWIDIPGVLPRAIRYDLYAHLAKLQPNAFILFNHGIGDGSKLNIHYAWPTDLMVVERDLPNSMGAFQNIREVEGEQFYLAPEVCDPIGQEWFYVDGDMPRSDDELLGMYLIATARGGNFLLDVPPDRTGRIPDRFADALMRVKRRIDALEALR